MQNFPFVLTFKREWNNSAMVINSNYTLLMWQSLSQRIPMSIDGVTYRNPSSAEIQPALGQGVDHGRQCA